MPRLVDPLGEPIGHVHQQLDARLGPLLLQRHELSTRNLEDTDLRAGPGRDPTRTGLQQAQLAKDVRGLQDGELSRTFGAFDRDLHLARHEDERALAVELLDEDGRANLDLPGHTHRGDDLDAVFGEPLQQRALLQVRGQVHDPTV